MAKLRLKITKEPEIRFISHLDYASAIERAVRRAKLPAAYSEGFNPHMKLAFASALAVGVTSSAEYMDLELKEEMPPETVIAKLTCNLPTGVKVHCGKYVEERAAALMKIVRLASYTITVSLPNEIAALLEKSLKNFNAKETIPYTRKSQKGAKQIDIKEYLASDIDFAYNGQDAILLLNIKIMPTGSVKPSEVLEAICTTYEIPVNPASAQLHRSGLFIEETAKVTPLDV